MTVKRALYVSKGFVEQLKKKDFFWKKDFFTPFVELERKKIGFWRTFSGVGPKFATILAEKTFWVRKYTFPELLFDNFHTVKFFGTTYIFFVVFWDFEGENVRPFGEN